MKLTVEPRTLETIGVTEELEYSVEVTPQAMEVLSGLYSDIPWAIVREYGTNMLDAYVKLPKQAKRLAPQLHVPNAMEPYIEFKDFGVGMNEQVLRRIFTTYFASTKRDNNDEVGGLGLGSKTAFAYEGCESWSIESRYNGQRFVFMASKNERHIPALNLIGKFPTEEPNGVTVKIPVATADLKRFQTACERLLRYFPIPVDVSGAPPSFKSESLPYVLRGKNWGLRLFQPANPGSQVIMGNVPYPVALDELRQYTKFDTSWNTSYTQSWSLDLWLPVGAVRITPSREALMYTPGTRERLKLAVDEFLAELPEKLAAEITTAPTLWEAHVALRKLCINPLQSIARDVKWRGHTLTLEEGIMVEHSQLPPGVQYQHLRNEQHKCVFRSYTKADGAPDPSIRTGSAKKHYLVVDDLGKGGYSLARQYLIHECTRVGYNDRRTWTADGSMFLFTGITKAALSKLFGDAPVLTTTELSDWQAKLNPTQLQTLTPRRKTKLRQLDVTQDYHMWQEVNVDTARTAFYVPLHNDDVLHTTLSNLGLKRAVVLAKIMTYLPSTEEIFGIPRSCKSVEKLAGWTDVAEYILQKMTADLTPEAWVSVLTWRTWAKLMDGEVGKVVCAILDNPPSGGRSVVLWQRIKKALPDVAKVRALSELAELYKLEPPKGVKPDHDGDKEFKALLKKYPLLAVFQAIDEQRRKTPYQPVPLTKFKAEITEYLTNS